MTLDYELDVDVAKSPETVPGDSVTNSCWNAVLRFLGNRSQLSIFVVSYALQS